MEEGELGHNGGMSFDRVQREPGLFCICFVCTGNICRSPMAESVFRSLIQARGLQNRVSVRSAGTGEWHVGEHSDDRTLASLQARGQERILKNWAPSDEARSKVHLLMSFDPDNGGVLDVPDPYYSDAAMFDTVLGMIERACEALFRQLEPGLRQGAS